MPCLPPTPHHWSTPAPSLILSELIARYSSHAIWWRVERAFRKDHHSPCKTSLIYWATRTRICHPAKRCARFAIHCQMRLRERKAKVQDKSLSELLACPPLNNYPLKTVNKTVEAISACIMAIREQLLANNPAKDWASATRNRREKRDPLPPKTSGCFFCGD